MVDIAFGDEMTSETTRKIIIRRNRPYENNGMYGVTVSEPRRGGAFTVKPLGNDEELSALLIDFGFSKTEINEVLAELEDARERQPARAYVTRVRTINALQIAKHGLADALR